MTHHVETRGNRPSLFYVDRPRPESWRNNPWGYPAGGLTPSHGQAATVREGEPVTWDAAFRLGRLDFTVEARPLFTTRLAPDANGKRAIPVPMARALVRAEDEAVIGYQSDTRALIQNAEVRACFEASGLTPDSAAVLDGGARLYAQALERTDEVRAGDTGRVATFLTFFWGHGAETGAVIPGRTKVGIVCTNTYGHALASVAGFERIAHRGNGSSKVAALARRLEREAEEQKAWLDTARRLAETPRAALGSVTVADLLTTAMVGEAATYEAAHARTTNVVDEVARIMRRADPRTGVVGDGSLWDLFQAATYYTSHERTVRGVQNGAAEVARRLNDTPAWVGATWDALAAVAADAAPVSVLVAR